MKKRAFCLLLALLVASLTLLPAGAADVSDTGPCGDGLVWTLDVEGVLTVSGSGDMGTGVAYPRNAPGAVKTVMIEEGVTGIGERAFTNCVWLTRVSIPRGVTHIDKGAFDNCRRLTEVVIPDGVTEIGNMAFNDCEKLTRITIPASVKKIGYAAFNGCAANVGIYTGSEGRKVEIFYEGTREEWLAIDIGARNGFFAEYHINYEAPGVRVNVGGTPVAWTDVRPYIDENNRTMVPLRAVAEALGMTVSWDAYRREASFSVGTKTLTFPIGSVEAVKEDGTTVKMDTAAVINSNRTYAPIRYLAEYFGYTVEWDSAAKTVLIS